MKITTKTSPQGVEIEYIEYVQAVSQPDISSYKTMIELGRTHRNMLDQKKQKDGAK